MKPILLIFVLSFYTSIAFGQSNPWSLNTITTAVPFVNISPDARSNGLGSSGVATSADSFAFHWNTSKLAFSEKSSEIGVSYSPWLRDLVEDINYYSLSGYSKISYRHSVGGSIKYFDLGKIRFTDAQGNLLKEYSPNEFEFLAGYAFKLSEKQAIGINGKYIYSNLTGGLISGTQLSKPGKALAVDFSYTYLTKNLKIGSKDVALSIGANISNMGNKMSYVVMSNNRDFIPANLRLGSAFTLNLNETSSLTATLDFNKLLVPTLPAIGQFGQIISGFSTNVGSLIGAVHSFYDAPGIVEFDAAGNPIVLKNSRLKEELNEITIGGGLEYVIIKNITARGGFFYEHQSKGNRRYVTAGLGVNWRYIGLDFNYLKSLTQNNPLDNSISLSLSFRFD